MHRRAFLGLALVTLTPGCGLAARGPLEIVCDLDLAPILEKAAAAWPGLEGGVVNVATDLSDRVLAEKMETTPAAVVVVREPKQADRLQRTGLAKLEDRWTREIGGEKAVIVVTRGDFFDQRRSIAFAKWLASPEADAALASQGPRTQQITLLIVP